MCSRRAETYLISRHLFFFFLITRRVETFDTLFCLKEIEHTSQNHIMLSLGFFFFDNASCADFLTPEFASRATVSNAPKRTYHTTPRPTLKTDRARQNLSPSSQKMNHAQMFSQGCFSAPRKHDGIQRARADILNHVTKCMLISRCHRKSLTMRSCKLICVHIFVREIGFLLRTCFRALGVFFFHDFELCRETGTNLLGHPPEAWNLTAESELNHKREYKH